MKQSVHTRENARLDQAMAMYLLDAIATKSKHKKVKVNMECRRKLEIKWEERRLKRDISEYDFN